MIHPFAVSSSSPPLNFTLLHPTPRAANFPAAASPRRRDTLRVVNESTSSSAGAERSEADRMVDGLDFGELCDEFECISSPLVESTARQLVRDILELRQDNRAFGCFALSVKYKDPVRSFEGRDKYKRRLWATDALENPTTTVQQMEMLSTSVLNIKWTLRGKPKSPFFIAGGDVIVKVDSIFTMNQISGQVIEHEESWDLSESSMIAQTYFWMSRRIFATVEGGKDASNFIKDLTNRMATENKNIESYPDPTGDPTKFFQRDDNFQRDLYQIALFIAIVYFVVQYLRTIL
ncbi:uncharacterized protein LOC127243990 [Andrographis paniculata]|uniref:uncharacterized protein LOC127243990 n=1 Tax=Andrographis paniculata TaxID=175694 RepID=UPI0021E90584|nr:uncharacterized protein LOC127243990 [Andrographis paniculata]